MIKVLDRLNVKVTVIKPFPSCILITVQVNEKGSSVTTGVSKR